MDAGVELHAPNLVSDITENLHQFKEKNSQLMCPMRDRRDSPEHLLHPVVSFETHMPPAGTGSESEEEQEPIAVKQDISGPVYVALKKAPAGDSLEGWLSSKVETILSDVIVEARKGAAQAAEEDPEIEGIDSDTVVVTVTKNVREEDDSDSEVPLGDRILDATFGETSDVLVSGGTIQIDLYGETANAVESHIESSAEYDSVVEFIGHRVFDEVLGDAAA